MSSRHKLGAVVVLLQRYQKIGKHFWSIRKSITPPQLSQDEAEFLPSSLAVQNQPVSPAARWLAIVLVAIVVFVLLWSIFGKVDVIINAQGKVIPIERTKSITSGEVSVVRAVHVVEGQSVSKGTLLIELDPSSVDVDAAKADAELEAASLSVLRVNSLLKALDSNEFPRLAMPISVDQTRYQEAAGLLSRQWLEYTSKRSRLSSEISRHAESLEVLKKIAKNYEILARTNDVPQNLWLEKEQQLVDLRRQLDDARNQQTVLLAETRRVLLESLAEARRLSTLASEEKRRATAKGEWLRLVSPIDGTVQQLVALSNGSAVPAVQPLMQIVPSNGGIEIEAMIENKDVGFLREGQNAAVKIDTFEYTKYGTLPARVVHVSRDAIQDEKRGLIYSVKVKLLQSDINVNGVVTDVTAGMSGSVEIKTGSRRVVEYFLSPLLRHTTESIRER